MPKDTWGGSRPGSGRRPKGEVAGVAHHTRPQVKPDQPILVTMAVKKELGNLRKKAVHDQVRACLIESGDTERFRVCHYALARHQFVLVVEAADRVALSRGMQGINVRVAKNLNRLWDRNGAVFADRYATQILTRGPEVRRALARVYLGFRAHAAAARKLHGKFDPYSSARYFDGWEDATPSPLDGAVPVASARSTLLRRTWRRSGLLSVNEAPPIDA